jgi:hypothetical protein
VVGILLAVLVAALTFAILRALDVDVVVGIVCAVVVFGASVPTIGNRFGIRNYY